MAVEFTLAQNSLYDPDLQQLIFTNVFMPPAGNTLVLILMANGSYSGVDFGPIAGQYDGTWPFVANTFLPITLTDTVIPLGGILETWPTPSPPYEVLIEPGSDFKEEAVMVTGLDRVTNTITVTRSSPNTHNSGIIIRGDTLLTDTGSTPPLLYVPGEPTLAPARTGSWWAHIVSGSNDTSFALWQSRYWQSAPTLPVGRPVWATLCMLARKIDGTEASSGLYDPLTNELRVALLGAVPSPFLIQPRGTLLAFTDTIEILPLPEVFGDLTMAPDPVPTVPPDPRWPPYAWYYPLPTWLPRLIGSLPNDNEDLWLPIQLSSKRSQEPLDVIQGWDDITGMGPEDNPLFFQDENWFSLGNYATRRQIAEATFTATHDPNPITYDLLKVGLLPSVANVPNVTLGASREPCVGQLPWWEIEGVKPSDLKVNAGTSVTPPEYESSGLYSQRLHTGNVILLVAQSDGLGAPTDPDGWTPIPEVSGPHPLGHQPVTIETSLFSSVLAGASTIQVFLNDLLDLGPVPFTAVIDAGQAFPEPPPPPPAPPLPPIDVPSETLTVSSSSPAAGWATLGVGSVAHPHAGGTRVVLTNPGLLAYDQYVGAWWKVAEGPPPNEFGVPSEAVEVPPTVSFPDGTMSSARMYAIMAEPTGPFSLLSTGAPGVARIDVPSPAALFGGADVIPEDGITLRAGIALAVGNRQVGTGPTGLPIGGLQDIRHGDLGTLMMQPVANPYVPSYSWHRVDPASLAVALVFAFRGMRERPLYELVDGHYAPSYINRGALPPCAGGGFHSSSDMRLGEHIHLLSLAPPSPPLLENVLLSVPVSGNARYLHAWLWSEGGAGATIKATIFGGGSGPDSITIPWFEQAAGAVDFYAEPPPDYIFKDELAFTCELTTTSGATGYYGFAVWSEEECQPPTAASYGLTAAFRYRHKDLHSPSNQQASIVG